MISILLPTRHRPEGLVRAIRSLESNADNPNGVEIVVGVDTDDTATTDAAKSFSPGSAQVRFSIVDREDTLGAKLNRLARESRGNILIYFADDIDIGCKNWDTKIEEGVKTFPDGLAIYSLTVPECGNHLFAFMPLVTRQMYEALGYFAPEDFPFWWWDTWLDEIGEFTGRKIRLPVPIKSYAGRGKTKGLRDVAFWAAYFDATRNTRIADSNRALSQMDAPEGHRIMMAQRKPFIADFLLARNSNLCDPKEAAYFESAFAEDDGIEEQRYRRVKSRAEEILKRSIAA